jgi:mono/diheme cytochrome c family protein
MTRLFLVVSLLTSALPLAAQTPSDLQNIAIPFMTTHCFSCHGPEKKRADLVLHVYKDEASILKDRKKWQTILHMVANNEMPPEGRARPKAEEIEAFTKAVHGIFERHDRAAGPDPGRVTMRRLNRTEYNNTIRDLVGVDFQAAEDFPTDDVGFGFDNIGDVLTISPLHMERYLAAAENIMSKAIVAGKPAPPPVKTAQGRFLEPGGNHPQPRPLVKGALNTPYNITQGGDFKVIVRAFARQAGDEPVKFALLAGSNELKQFEIRSSEKKPLPYEAAVTLPKGPVRIYVQLLNPFTTADKKDRALMVEHIQLIGPMDTRPDSHRALLACDPGLDEAAKTRHVLKRFADRAYRRPATTDEVERLVKFVEFAQKRGDSWEAGVALAMQAVLVSPKFLFRVELDPRSNAKGPQPLDEHQLASRLSYFLWNSMPDDELFELAGKKALNANLDAQVARMLKDPKAASFVESFFVQWLQLQPLRLSSPDAMVFPDFNEKLRGDMLKETALFFKTIVAEDRSVLEIIDTDWSFVNERLARHYGIIDTNGNRPGPKPLVKGKPDPSYKPGQPIKGEAFVKVKFQQGQRGGVLTQASVLTVTSNPTRTSPVKRGRWVLEQILGTPPPPPPPNVPELDEKKQTTGSLRQRMEQHRQNVACAGCHARMDPIGFAFENFDGIGKFRTKDGEFPIDPSGVLPNGQSFQGPQELKRILLGKKELFTRCLTEKMLTYALGRGLEYYDRPAIDRIVAALPKSEFRFSTLIAEVAKSDPFRMRRGQDKAEP